jgi:AraC-like DNA-binding protein
LRTVQLLVDRPEFTIRVVRCHDDHARWSPPEQTDGYGFVLVRRGGFRRVGRGGEVLADPTVGYLSGPGDEECFAHPYGGDECTSIRLHPDLVTAHPGPVYVDARTDLAHRLLLRAAHGADHDYAVAERLLRLASGAGNGVPDKDRAVVETARQAIRAGTDEAAALVPLARSLGVSPYRLSRSFHALVGVPLTRYRNRVRVGAALDRIEAGEADLARLAAELGFADQAHLTRTVRDHLGHTPKQLTRLLAGVRV